MKKFFIINMLVVCCTIIVACITTKRLIPCSDKPFQSMNTAVNNYNWGDDNYIKAKNTADPEAKSNFCSKAVRYRGTAYCKAPYDPRYKLALQEAVGFCPDEAMALGISIELALSDSSSDALTDNNGQEKAAVSSANKDGNSDSASE